jgi:hypothetical protein
MLGGGVGNFAKDVEDFVDVEGCAVDVAVGFGHKGGSGRKDTCWGLSCDCRRRNAVLAYKFERARWNMRWKIATEDAGSTGPGMCELACRRRREAMEHSKQFKGVEWRVRVRRRWR